MKTVQIFTDGSSLGNPGAGGWCAILRYGSNEKVISGSQAGVTNNQMELLAVIEALKLLNQPCEVKLISDSNYVVRGINEWLYNWQKKGFEDIKNPHMWREYFELSKCHKVTAVWVRGHDGHPENERCDKIAKYEAMRMKDGKF